MTEKSIVIKRLREEVNSKLDQLLEDIDYKYSVQDYTLKPSEIQHVLHDYDLGFRYEDWFFEGEGEWS